MGGSGSSLNGQGSSSSSSSPSLSGGAARPSLSKRHGAGSSSSSFLSLGGVPWYRVTAAVQHQVRVLGVVGFEYVRRLSSKKW